ncbi:MAG TPA: glutamate 5-kinase [bacterium]|nr:glutamate 5-kinase [bacterium]
MTSERKKHLSGVKRIVIKAGSSLLTDSGRMKVQTRFLTNLAKQVKSLRQRGIQCVIVTSGAIAAGMFGLGLRQRPKDMSKLQALAAVGQSNLMHAYEATFQRFGLKVAQILLTREDLSDRGRYSNAHNTFIELFRYGIVPVVNENDTVAVEEIRFGDNDTLGVLVSHLCEADLLILLTDKDGYFNEDPVLNPKAKLISDIYQWDDSLEKNAGKPGSQVGTGGMLTKMKAAKNMMRSGIPMVIANGAGRSVLTRIMDSEKIGTFFHPSTPKMASRKRWLAWSVQPKGELTVDEGAEKALVEKNKSLLPSGVRKVYGEWEKGDIVRILALDGREIAKGISNYSSRDLNIIKGLKTVEVSQKLGPGLAAEVVHMDNLVKTG